MGGGAGSVLFERGLEMVFIGGGAILQIRPPEGWRHCKARAPSRERESRAAGSFSHRSLDAD